MYQPVKLADLELSTPIPEFTGLEGYAFLQLLLRWRGRPFGYITVPVLGNRCGPSEIAGKVIDEHSDTIKGQLLRLSLENPVDPVQWNVKHFLTLLPSSLPDALATVSVVVCTRDRTDDLLLCLSALTKLKPAPLEILIIDNAPATTATRELVKGSFPEVRYVLEPRPGLDWARNRAITEARGEIVAYTDDDVVVDDRWTESIARLFTENQDVMAVTGLVVPYELETEAQYLFEKYGGFGRGFVRKWYRARGAGRHHLAAIHAGAGKFGTGANMAFRRCVFAEIGLFDPALDVGTVTNGGGDLDMFFRVLKHGHTLVYEPAAMVRHRHRRDYGLLRSQIANNGIGFYSYLVRNAVAFPEERWGLARVGGWWFCEWNLRRWVESYFKPTVVPRDLISAELVGSWVGLFRYQKARASAKALSGPESPVVIGDRQVSPRVPKLNPKYDGIAVRTVEITENVSSINDISDYGVVRLFVTWKGMAMGEVNIASGYGPLSAARIVDEIVQCLGLQLMNPMGGGRSISAWSEALEELKKFISIDSGNREEGLADSITASIVVATCDRPDDLRRCLDSLCKQRTSRLLEIIVVDNQPLSGLTPPVVCEFPGVLLVSEARGGLSYARNAGFVASRGEIIVCTDDDVVAPPDWLERLLAPFSRNNVMMVTGNVLPATLDDLSHVEFENYGGLGRGFHRREFDRTWFDSFRHKAVPTWTIGATANAALRAAVLHDPAIGLLDEALGAGSPAGCSEDTYLFYKVLKAGHSIIYEPRSYVWHYHRTGMDDLYKQIHCYSVGHAAYHLTTVLRDRDSRGLIRIFAEIPMFQIRQLVDWLRGSRRRSLRTIVLEIHGNAFGGFALWKSRRRARRMGSSSPYLPVNHRSLGQADEAGLGESRYGGVDSDGPNRPISISARDSFVNAISGSRDMTPARELVQGGKNTKKNS